MDCYLPSVFLNYYQAQNKIQSIADKRSLFATIGKAQPW